MSQNRRGGGWRPRTAATHCLRLFPHVAGLSRLPSICVLPDELSDFLIGVPQKFQHHRNVRLHQLHEPFHGGYRHSLGVLPVGSYGCAGYLHIVFQFPVGWIPGFIRLHPDCHLKRGLGFLCILSGVFPGQLSDSRHLAHLLVRLAPGRGEQPSHNKQFPGGRAFYMGMVTQYPEP